MIVCNLPQLCLLSFELFQDLSQLIDTLILGFLEFVEIMLVHIHLLPLLSFFLQHSTL